MINVFIAEDEVTAREQIKLLVTPGCRGFFPATIKDLRRASTGERVIAIIGKNLRLAIDTRDDNVVTVVSGQRMRCCPFRKRQRVEECRNVGMCLNDCHRFPLF